VKAYENVVRWQYADLQVRVWFGREWLDHSAEFHRGVLENACETFLHNATGLRDELNIAHALLGMLREHRVNAIEVLRNGQGSIIYPEWP
jgi:hypothetical protein